MQNNNKDYVADPDKGWVPSGRPQSTIARNFSADLDNLFNIDTSFDAIANNVFQKKHEVHTKSAELEALDARLKAMEERLKKASTDPSPLPTSRKNSQRRTPVQGAFDDAHHSGPASPLSQHQHQHQPQHQPQHAAHLQAPAAAEGRASRPTSSARSAELHYRQSREAVNAS